MDENPELELAYFDMLEAHTAAIGAAIGSLALGNVPTERVRIISETTTNEIIRLAARALLWQRKAL